MGNWNSPSRRTRFLAAAAIVSSPILTFAQATSAPSDAASDAEWRQRMEARMQQLERENAELKKEVGEVHQTQRAVMKDAESRGVLNLEGGQPRLTTPDFFDLNKYASEGNFPGSIRMPNSNTSFQIGGFVQLDAITDTDRIGNKDAFVVSSIPTGNERTGAGNSNFSVRQTRLFMKSETPTEGWGNLITYVEIDFQGTDGTEPRLRHAYGQFGDKWQFLAGQTWSAFQDATVFPNTLDAQGPPGIINSRRGQVRVRREINSQWAAVMALEDPQSDITTPVGDPGQKSTPYPDLDGNIRWTPDWGHLQLSGVLRYLQFDPDSGSRESDVGYGLSLTGAINTIRLDDKHIDSILFQLANGNGIERYINDTSGLGLDGVVLAPGDELEGLNVWAGLAGYQHWWNRRWASTASYSFVVVDNNAGEPGSDYQTGQYGVLNLRYYPTERVMIGGEMLYGVRKDKDGSSGDDLRLQFSAQYKF